MSSTCPSHRCASPWRRVAVVPPSSFCGRPNPRTIRCPRASASRSAGSSRSARPSADGILRGFRAAQRHAPRHAAAPDLVFKTSCTSSLVRSELWLGSLRPRLKPCALARSMAASYDQRSLPRPPRCAVRRTKSRLCSHGLRVDSFRSVTHRGSTLSGDGSYRMTPNCRTSRPIGVGYPDLLKARRGRPRLRPG
jgi:hypothetical protein